MRQILILSDPDRVDRGLVRQLQRLFPECDVRVILKRAAAAAGPAGLRPADPDYRANGSRHTADTDKNRL